MNLIFVYAAPSVSRRSGLWYKLSEVLQRLHGPVLIGGDFNTIVRLDERSGGNGLLSADSVVFGDWIQSNSLIDLGFSGSQFTWKRGKTERTYVAKRLDRVLCCPQARLKWQNASVKHLPFLASDHAHIYLQLCPVVRNNPRRRPFRFEAAWLKHPSFSELLTASWDTRLTTPEALTVLQTKLRKWNRDVFGDVHKRKEELMVEIKRVQDILESSQTDTLLLEEENLLTKMEEVLEQEELLWLQKSREDRIAFGDRNTKYFHMTTVIRRRYNRIDQLRDDDGRWVSEQQELEQLAVDYYRKLYSLDDVNSEVDPLPVVGFVGLPRQEQLSLNKPFTGNEVESAIRSMGRLKTPGPDGYQPVFYQDCWEVVGESVTKFVLEFFNSGNLPPNTNSVLVALLPKVQKPERIRQFRPISLCNVLFKTITKVMVIRLKSVIAKLIGPAQSSFIPGRLSMDNIVIVQEAVHSMRRKQGRKGWMLLKLDLEKAYDRIRWDFLEDTLRATGLNEEWVRWILQCVMDPAMTILWNGEKTEEFRPSRGLRQGDPLSPYLFVLCLERLCHMIDRSVASGAWKPICLSRGGPKLSHICFADDLILFAEASVSQVRIIRRVLERFCESSGQRVSLDKSKIFFSEKVSRELRTMITGESGIGSTVDLGKYLGMPVLQKRINKDTFAETLVRVSSRLAGWRGKSLSAAGRLTLTKSVLASIPVHTMSTIHLPKSILDGLDKASRSFLWGSLPEKRKQHLVAWDTVCLPRREGGLGLRKSPLMNKALLAKLGWRLLNDESSLWAKVLRHKYKFKDIRDQSWLNTKRPSSSTWKSIRVGLKDVVLKGINWVVGDGCEVRFWSDRWLSTGTLADAAVIDLPLGLEDRRVKDYWADGRGWLLPQILPYVSPATRLELSAVVVDTITGEKDRVSWGRTADGEFTVKSAYALLAANGSLGPNVSSQYHRIWQVIAPERTRMFFWLVAHQSIMTNVERHRRHFGDSTVCQVCKGSEETILHVLRDCPSIRGIWERIVPMDKRTDFFQSSMLDWLYVNLGSADVVDGCTLPTLFAIGVWWSWKWRCGYIFGEVGRCRDRTKFVKDSAKEVQRIHEVHVKNGESGPMGEKMISWSRPPEGWLKLNTDGAVRGNPGLAAAGGVLRDAAGHWCEGFSLNIGVCSAPLAELWGVYYGLCVVWGRRAKMVELEVDSRMVVDFLTTGINDSHPLSFLVRLCHGFLSRDWLVRISHVYREANRLADGLANHAFSLPLGFQYFDSIPVVLDSLGKDDLEGLAIARRVRL